ncbi:MAG TPA: tetratricopeptide repeat protein, partial [Terriglobales bacterium]|nr:tetratricopeptide repeat protein [Terriglobales bacterium]
VDARDNRELWGARYERRLENMLDVQEEISQEVSDNLRNWMTGAQKEALTKHYPANSEAYQLYLQGRYHWSKRAPQEIYKGIEYFQQAIGKDPNYALAYAGLADCYLSLGSAPFGPLEPRQSMPQAKAAALKALELDGTVAEAHNSLAYLHLVYDLDLRAADREFKRAIELNPNYALAHQWRGLYYTAIGHMDQAIAEITRARELDPLNPVVYTAMAQAYCFDGQNDACIEQARKALELDPDFALAHFNVGRGFEQKQMYDEAIAEFQQGGPLIQQSPAIVAALGYTYAAAGQRREALQKLAQLQTLSKQVYVPALYTAALYTALGDRDNAFAYLEKAYEEKSEYLVFLNMDPVINNLRSDPRYNRFLQRIGILDAVRK